MHARGEMGALDGCRDALGSQLIEQRQIHGAVGELRASRGELREPFVAIAFAKRTQRFERPERAQFPARGEQQQGRGSHGEARALGAAHGVDRGARTVECRESVCGGHFADALVVELAAGFDGSELEIGGSPEPLYVVRVDAANRQVVVGPRAALAVAAALKGRSTAARLCPALLERFLARLTTFPRCQ